MMTRGFTLVNTPRLCAESLCRRIKKGTLILRLDDKRWWKYPELARYARWLEWLLGQSLPEESVALRVLEFRHEPAGTVDREVDRLHVDGSYIRSVFTLYGLPTFYRAGTAELPVPRGQTLLITAMARAKSLRIPGTLHRRPGAGPERGVIVCSFEPRQDQGHCQVALAPAKILGPRAVTRSTEHPSCLRTFGRFVG
jgi:hypothetical protein